MAVSPCDGEAVFVTLWDCCIVVVVDCYCCCIVDVEMLYERFFFLHDFTLHSAMQCTFYVNMNLP